MSSSNSELKARQPALLFTCPNKASVGVFMKQRLRRGLMHMHGREYLNARLSLPYACIQ